MWKARKKERKDFSGLIGIIALILGIVALLIGWMGYGGYLFGIPAVVLGYFSYRRRGGIIPLLSIVVGCIGIAETIAVMHIFLPVVLEETKKEVGLIEETIPVPYVFNLSEGQKLRLESIKVEKSEYVAENYTLFTESYKVYYPRGGFVFYIVRYTLENVGGKKIDSVYFPILNLITSQETYSPLYFYEMKEERGYKQLVTNETRYASSVCEEPATGELYPGEKVTLCRFFEIRENEKPIKLKLEIWPSTYYINLD